MKFSADTWRTSRELALARARHAKRQLQSHRRTACRIDTRAITALRQQITFWVFHARNYNHLAIQMDRTTH